MFISVFVLWHLLLFASFRSTCWVSAFLSCPSRKPTPVDRLFLRLSISFSLLLSHSPQSIQLFSWTALRVQRFWDYSFSIICAWPFCIKYSISDHSRIPSPPYPFQIYVSPLSSAATSCPSPSFRLLIFRSCSSSCTIQLYTPSICIIRSRWHWKVISYLLEATDAPFSDLEPSSQGRYIIERNGTFGQE